VAAYDVIVIGAGNAALAAAVAARDAGAERVLVLEKASEELRGGNTHYSGGLLRIAFNGVEEILRLMPKARELPGFVEGVEAYPAAAFLADLRRMTANRTDPELAEILIANSYATASWMAETGIRFEPAISLGAVRVGGVIKWPKGAIVRAVNEGVGLSRMWFVIAQRKGAEVRYRSAVLRLTQDSRGQVCGVTIRDPHGIHKPIWDQFKEEPFELPPDKPLTLASYAAGPEKVAYVENVAVADRLVDNGDQPHAIDRYLNTRQTGSALGDVLG